MATQIQWRRGNTAQTAAFTGVLAEVTVDTDKKTLVVHDGTTAGGIPLAKEGTLSTSYNHANGAFDKANSANVLAQSAFDKANQTAQLAFTTVSANGTTLTADANNDTLTITSAVANGVFVTGISGSDTLDIGLIDSGVTASGYGDSISVPTFVVDAKGRLTSASNTTIRSGTTSQTGVVRLEDSVTSTSTSNAATPASVKTAYDLATTANTNAINAGTYANAAFDKANSANVLAQAGFDKANTATTTAGLAYDHANGAFDKANTATTTTGLAYNHANGAFDKANTATTTADAAFAKANSANVIAQAAFDNSNTKFASSGGSITGDVSVTGNLTVVGQTIYANTTTALIADNLLTLNAAINQASAPVSDAGIEIDRGSSANVSLLWNESTDKWTFTNDGTTYYNIADADRLDSSFNHANGAFDKANTATTTAGLAYNHANGAFDKANTATTTTGLAYDHANGAFIQANSGYNLANSIANNTTTAGTANVANYAKITTKSDSTNYYIGIVDSITGNLSFNANSALYFNPGLRTLVAPVGQFGTSVTTTSLLPSSTIVTVFNTTATTIRMGGEATTINIGNVNGTTAITGNVTVSKNVTAANVITTGVVQFADGTQQSTAVNAGDSLAFAIALG